MSDDQRRNDPPAGGQPENPGEFGAQPRSSPSAPDSPQPRFDPFTGAPLSEEDRSLQPRFDPYTGKPLDAATTAAATTDGQPEAPATVPGPAAEYVTPTSSGRLAQRGRRRTRVLIMGAVVLVILAVVGGLLYAQRDQSSATASGLSEGERTSKCQDELKDTFDALKSINSQLDVGMQEANYSTAVGQAKASFDNVDADNVEKYDCAAFHQLETALDKYIAASQYWNNCIVTDYCTPSSSKLNRWWEPASAAIATVEDNGIGASSGGNS